MRIQPNNIVREHAYIVYARTTDPAVLYPGNWPVLSTFRSALPAPNRTGIPTVTQGNFFYCLVLMLGIEL